MGAGSLARFGRLLPLKKESIEYPGNYTSLFFFLPSDQMKTIWKFVLRLIFFEYAQSFSFHFLTVRDYRIALPCTKWGGKLARAPLTDNHGRIY